MVPVSVPTGQAWILRELADEPTRQPVGRFEVWWLTGNGRELVKVNGEGFTEDQLVAVLPALQPEGAWGYSNPAALDLTEVPHRLVLPWHLRSSQTILPDGNRVTIIVQTGTHWDLLQQSSTYLPVTDRPSTTTLPGGNPAVVRADPGNFHVFWLEGEALVHLSASMSEDLATILGAVRIAP